MFQRVSEEGGKQEILCEESWEEFRDGTFELGLKRGVGFHHSGEEPGMFKEH